MTLARRSSKNWSPFWFPFPTSDSLMIKFIGSTKCGNIPPSMGPLLNNLLQPGFHNMWNFINRISESGVTGKDVLASFIIPSMLLEMTSPERHLYGALDIPMTKYGLKVCKYKVSDYLQDKKYLISDRAWMTMTFTMSGAITNTHMNYYGHCQYIVHLFSQKLWLLWPPTKKTSKASQNSTHSQQPYFTLPKWIGRFAAILHNGWEGLCAAAQCPPHMHVCGHQHTYRDLALDAPRV